MCGQTMHPTYFGCGRNTMLDRAFGARRSNARSLDNAASMPAWRRCSPSCENGPLGAAYRMRMGQARGNHPQHDHNAHWPTLSRPTCSLSWRGGAGALSDPTRPHLRLVIARRGRRTLGTDEAPSAACHCEEGPAHSRYRRGPICGLSWRGGAVALSVPTRPHPPRASGIARTQRPPLRSQGQRQNSFSDRTRRSR
jgi:hypothetical protein